MNRKRYTKEVIQQAQKVHGDKYDYSKTKYRSARESFTVVCPEHGPWETTHHSHIINRHGCQPCGAQKQAPSLEEIKQKFRSKHGEFYDYDQVVWDNTNGPGWHKKVIIGCPKHGLFEQTPAVHYYQGAGCLQCGKEKSSKRQRKKKDVFFKQARDRHGERYDYSKTVYKGDQKNIDIGCKTHGVFTQRADHHLNGCGCPSCHHDRLAIEFAYNYDQFLQRAKETHNNKFKYVKESWISYQDEITVICPKHGQFGIVAKNHANGSGCSICNTSRLGRSVEKALMNYDVTYTKEKRFKDCRNIHPLPFDIYLDEYEALIECDGEQHYHPRENGLFTADKVIEIQHRDTIKNKWAEERGIPLIRIRYDCLSIHLILGLFLFAIQKRKSAINKTKVA